MKKALAIFTLLVLLASAPGPAPAQEKGPAPEKAIPAQASFSSPSVPLGQSVDLCLSFPLPEGAALIEPLRFEGLSRGEVLGVKEVEGGVCFTLLAADLESLHVPAISLAARAADGGLLTVRSEPAALSVTADLPENPEKAAARPISGLLKIPASWLKILPWAAGGLLALLLLAGGIYLLRRRMGRTEALKQAARPAHETAMEELDRLGKALGKNEIEEKPFYFDLTLAVKAYLGAIRGFPAADLTTQELAGRLDGNQDRALLPMLREADLVKFAKKPATRAAMEAHLGQARGYVQDTMPRPEEESEK